MTFRPMRLASSPQSVVLLTAIAFTVVLSILNPAVLSVANLVDLARNGLVTGIFAIGVMLVLAPGGIDVSFTAIGAFTMYETMKLVIGLDLAAPSVAIFATGALLSGGHGLLHITDNRLVGTMVDRTSRCRG